MDINKQDSKMLKGVAVLGMLLLHLFCRKTDLPYTPLLWLGDTPFVYYIGLFGDMCVPIFCFVTGYAHYMQAEKPGGSSKRWQSLLKFFITFWLVAITFSIIGLIVGCESIPNSPLSFLLNCLTLENSYNGAWWYANTYLLFVLLQPLLVWVAKKTPLILLLPGAFVLYFVGYAMRFPLAGTLAESFQPVVYDGIQMFAQLLTSLFPYIIGAVFRRFCIMSKLRVATARMKTWLLDLLVALAFVVMIAAHGVVQSAFVAVFTGVGTVLLLCLCRIPRPLSVALQFIGDHSTVIWLSHMFFYVAPFSDLAFRAKYVLPVFLLLFALSLLTSLIIKLISKPIFKLLPH